MAREATLYLPQLVVQQEPSEQLALADDGCEPTAKAVAAMVAPRTSKWIYFFMIG